MMRQHKTQAYQQAIASGYNVNYKTVKCRYYEATG